MVVQSSRPDIRGLQIEARLVNSIISAIRFKMAEELKRLAEIHDGSLIEEAKRIVTVEDREWVDGVLT